MPGVDLDLDLPTLADTFSDIVSKLVVALDAIELDLAAQVTAGELDIDTELSVGGAPITNVGGLQLSGGISTSPGTLYMEGNEFYIATLAGVIKLTDNGAINIAATGTIGGDYGIGNPASVTYDDASGEYRFVEEAGVYADLVADDVILKAAAGSVRLTADAASVSAYTVTMPAALPASTNLLTVTSAGVVAADGVLSANANLTLSGTGRVKMVGLYHTMPFWYPLVQSTGTVSYTVSKPGVILASGSELWHPILGVPGNASITSVTVYAESNGSVTHTYSLNSDTVVAGVHTQDYASVTGTTVVNSLSAGLTITPFVLTTGRPLMLRVLAGAADIHLTSIVVGYSIP